MTKTVSKTKKETKNFKLEQAFAMWKRKAKSGMVYFTGKYNEGEIRGFYNTKKKNPNEPDLRIYSVGKDGDLNEEIISLWCNAKENKKKYLSGKLGDKRVVGFFNDKATEENKQPYFSVYYSENNAEKQNNENKKDEEIELPF